MATLTMATSPTATSNEVPVPLSSLGSLMKQLTDLVDAGKAAANATATPAGPRSARLADEAEALHKRALNLRIHQFDFKEAVTRATEGLTKAKAEAKRHEDEATRIESSAAAELEKARKKQKEQGADAEDNVFDALRDNVKKAEALDKEAKEKATAKRAEATRIRSAASAFVLDRSVAETLIKNASEVAVLLDNEAKRIEAIADKAFGVEKKDIAEARADRLEHEAHELSERARMSRRSALERYTGGDRDADFDNALASIESARRRLKTLAVSKREAEADVVAKSAALETAEKAATVAHKALKTAELLLTAAKTTLAAMDASGDADAYELANQNVTNCLLKVKAAKGAADEADAAVASAQKALEGAIDRNATLAGGKSEADLDAEEKSLLAVRRDTRELDAAANIKKADARALRKMW